MRRIILKYYPLLTIIIPFVLFIIPTAFINNNYLNLAIAQHIDSGALLESLFSMLKKDSFYNQNVGYQSSFYGFPFNSLLFWWFVFLNKLLKLDIVRDFPIYATSSRIISTLISVIILWIVYIFSSKFYKSNKIAFVITFLLAIFPGFSFYSTIVKPDQAALLFCIISFYFMYRFLLSNKSINYISAAILSFLALFTKQPYVFLFIPLFFGYWLNNNKITKITSLSIQLLKNFLITLLVLLPIIFIIHPYIFLHPQTYIFRQKQLTNMFNAPISENFKYWIILYKNWPIILIGYFSSFFFSISYFFVKSKSKQVKILFLLSTFILIYTIDNFNRNLL